MKSAREVYRIALLGAAVAVLIAGCAKSVDGAAVPASGARDQVGQTQTTPSDSDSMSSGKVKPTDESAQSQPPSPTSSGKTKTTSKSMVMPTSPAVSSVESPKPTPVSPPTSSPAGETIGDAPLDTDPAHFKPFDISKLPPALDAYRKANNQSSVTIDTALTKEAEACVIKAITGDRDCGQLFYWGPNDLDEIMGIFKNPRMMDYTLYPGVKTVGCAGVKNDQDFVYVTCLYAL